MPRQQNPTRRRQPDGVPRWACSTAPEAGVTPGGRLPFALRSLLLQFRTAPCRLVGIDIDQVDTPTGGTTLGCRKPGEYRDVPEAPGGGRCQVPRFARSPQPACIGAAGLNRANGKTRHQSATLRCAPYFPFLGRLAGIGVRPAANLSAQVQRFVESVSWEVGRPTHRSYADECGDGVATSARQADYRGARLHTD